MIYKPMSTARGAHSFKTTALVILALIFILYFTAHNISILYVRNHETGDILFTKALTVQETFTLHYIHSVTNQPVQEIFYVKNTKTLALKEMLYDSFGANLPVGPEVLAGETTTFAKEGDHYKVTYQNRTFTKVPLRVGQVVANHTLIFSDGQKLRFLDVAPGGAYVEYYLAPLINIF